MPGLVLARPLLASVDGTVLVFRTLQGRDGSGLNWRLQVSPLASLRLPRPQGVRSEDFGAVVARVTLSHLVRVHIALSSLPAASKQEAARSAIVSARACERSAVVAMRMLLVAPVPNVARVIDPIIPTPH
jgi:hypothetical protein